MLEFSIPSILHHLLLPLHELATLLLEFLKAESLDLTKSQYLGFFCFPDSTTHQTCNVYFQPLCLPADSVPDCKAFFHSRLEQIKKNLPLFPLLCPPLLQVWVQTGSHLYFLQAWLNVSLSVSSARKFQRFHWS